VQTISHVIGYPSRTSTFRLWHLTDWHIGAAACDEKLLRKHVQQIADDPNARWIGGGDYLDCISRKGDKRHHEETLAPWLHGKDDPIELQLERVLDIMQPIADKCLGLLQGNHEWAALQHSDRDVYRSLITRLAKEAKREPHTLALGAQGFIVTNFRRMTGTTAGNNWRMTTYVHHGYGGGRLPGGHALALGRVLGDYDCDIALMGHRHVSVSLVKTIVRPGPFGYQEHHRLGVFTPSYLRSYIIPSKGARRPVDTYPEKVGLPNTVVGATPLLIDPFARTYSATVVGGAVTDARQWIPGEREALEEAV
jgi:hypothetical protein